MGRFQMDCITKLDPKAFEQGIAQEITFALSCTVSSMLINRVGKFGVLCKYLKLTHGQNAGKNVKLYCPRAGVLNNSPNEWWRKVKTLVAYIDR